MTKEGNIADRTKYTQVELWNYGAMELWSYGAMELWSYGAMELWSYGAMELWNYGTMELWRDAPSKFYFKHLYTIYPQLTEGEPHQTSRDYNTKHTKQNLFTNVRGAL